jgi:hypothetical protein
MGAMFEPDGTWFLEAEQELEPYCRMDLVGFAPFGRSLDRGKPVPTGTRLERVHAIDGIE